MRLARHLPRFRAARRALPEIARREAWSRDEIEAWQLARLNTVWARAARRVPHYRRLAKERGLPERFESVEHFRETMPPLGRSPVSAAPGRFLAEDAGPGSWHRTGGSTGVAVSSFWEEAAHREMLRHEYRFLDMWGLGIFDRSAHLWGHDSPRGFPADLVRGVRTRVLDRLRNRLRLSAYRMGKADLRRDLLRMRRFEPALLYGYTTAVYLLALEARETGVALPSLRLVVLTSEPVDEPRARAVEEALGAPVAVEYGSVEVGFMAHSWPDGTLRVREDLVLLETLPREDGRHDILATGLANGAFPLFRYRLGDVTTAPLERPGRGFAILTEVLGRDSDLIWTAAGERLHPTRVELVIDSDPTARRYRVHQGKDGRIRALVEPVPGTRVPVERMEREIRRLTGWETTVEVVDSIPLTPAGKHRLITSDLDGPPA